MAYAYRVFISHVWRTQNSYYHGLIRLLDRAKYFNFRDIGVPRIRQIDRETPMNEILELVRSADAVLVVNKPAVGRSENVKLELAEALKCGIPIIAVNPPAKEGATNGSQYLANLRVRCVPWRRDSIVTAIREEVALSRRVRVATPTKEDAFEPVEEAAQEAKAHLTPAELVEVRGDDEGIETPIQSTQSETPKEVVLRDAESASLLAVPPKWSWLSKLFLRH